MNNGQTKNSKKVSEIRIQIGRNQSIQHCVGNFLLKTLPLKKDSFEGEKPTKEEFLEILWNEIESLITDLNQYVNFDESETETESETEAADELESIDIDSLM